MCVVQFITNTSILSLVSIAILIFGGKMSNAKMLFTKPMWDLHYTLIVHFVNISGLAFQKKNSAVNGVIGYVVIYNDCAGHSRR